MTECTKCNDTKWIKYFQHFVVCPQCCKHNKSFYFLTKHYGRDEGKWCCSEGCGYTIPYSQLIKFLKKKADICPIYIDIEYGG